LLFAFGKDISIKAVTLYGMKKGVNDILTRLQEEAKAQGIRKPTPPPPPAPQPPQKEYEEPEVEELSDEEIEYMERMENIMAEQKKIRNKESDDFEEPESQLDRKEGVDKMKITFDENPLRESVVREYPAPKVEETFIRGGEIIDEPTKTDDVSPSQSSNTNESEQ
jgi:hypothetical protein